MRSERPARLKAQWVRAWPRRGSARTIVAAADRWNAERGARAATASEAPHSRRAVISTLSVAEPQVAPIVTVKAEPSNEE
jgi:hypothetical protein